MKTKGSTENALRKRLSRAGYKLTKSRKAQSIDNFGEYMLIDAATNIVVAGSRYDLTLEQAEDFVKTMKL